MVQRRIKQAEPTEVYKEFSGAGLLRPQQLACLQKLAKWRLEQARERDMAVNFVVREEHLWKVARYMPTSLGELDGLDFTGRRSAATANGCWQLWMSAAIWMTANVRHRWKMCPIIRYTVKHSKRLKPALQR